MKATLTPPRSRKAALIRLVTLLLALAAAGLASAQNNTLTGTNAGTSITKGTRNTADGFDALQHDKAGSRNVAIGSNALQANVTGVDNTAVGYGALNANIFDDNTALGSGALFLNASGYSNTAGGFQALYSNTEGFDNTAFGYQALFANTTAGANTAVGTQALFSDTNGADNSAFGQGALRSNSSGSSNTAAGEFALFSNTMGSGNTASGASALGANVTGSSSTAFGFQALFKDTGVNGGQNIALGASAGYNTTGQLNIMIGNMGVAAESNTIRIGTNQGATYISGIHDASVTIDGTGAAVYVSADGKLGTVTSSRRFKKDIVDMADSSEALLSMRPVSFHYKPQGATATGREVPQFGLIAEEVAELNPDLVLRDAQGAIYSVRYEAVNAMLLNEFLKDHRRVEAAAQVNAEQTKTIAEQEEQIRALGTRLDQLSRQMQDLSERLGASKPAALQNAALQPEAQ